MFESKDDVTYKFLTYCNEYITFCKKNGIRMNVVELQNVGMKSGKFAIFDTGESQIDSTKSENYSHFKSEHNDMQSIAKELIRKHK